GSKVSGAPVTKAHYLVASSDTHDVIYPGIANDKDESSIYHSGKGRTYVYLGDTTGMSIEEVGLATGQAIANGKSFASLGPILAPQEDVMFGEKVVVTESDNRTFKTSIEVESLNGIDTILLLSNLGDMTYEYNGQTIKNVLKIDESYNGENKLTFEINERIASADAWFAVMAIDASENKMFAVSNPIWVKVDGSAELDLKDINSHWAKASIEKLVSTQAISGYQDGTFKPNNNITRAEFATILVKAFNLSPEQGTVFADTANHWAKDSIATAAAHGILTGYSADKFGPNDPITREQMAVMIVKAAKLADQEGGKTFADSSAISAWAVDAVNIVVGENIMGGYEDNTFKPQNKATRAEAATVIVKALGL
ncbi:MAG: S-layer homology domain-containing protein, partial [Dehalobacterium sp.]